MHGVLRISVAAVGLAAVGSLAPAGVARADTSPATPSLAEPSPTPGWAEAGPGDAGTAPKVQHRSRVYAHHYDSRRGHTHVYRSGNPLAAAATGVAGGVADLGSMAAYPFYCFPDYGSCPVRLPYRP